MPRSSFPPWLRGVAAMAVIAGALAILRPWTVRPLHLATPATFDAAAFVEQAWPRIMEEATRTAVGVAVARQPGAAGAHATAPARRSVFVRVTGTITAVDRSSRVGLARVRPSEGGSGEVTVQVGPVIRGTALRDATSFIRFTDFANQFEFAAVSSALHERVQRQVLTELDVDALTGTVVTVLGAATLPAGAAGTAPLDLVPLEIRAAGGQR